MPAFDSMLWFSSDEHAKSHKPTSYFLWRLWHDWTVLHHREEKSFPNPEVQDHLVDLILKL